METGTGEYLVISRGKWDANASPGDIQHAIDEFYAWLEKRVEEGRMRRGSRLAATGKTVGPVTTDGPYGEAKEVIGGYWFIVARSLEEAAQLAAENPCLKFGLFCEIRPLDPERARADAVTCETPER